MSQQPTGIHHIAVMAGDIKKHIAFFSDVLGFPLVGHVVKQAQDAGFAGHIDDHGRGKRGTNFDRGVANCETCAWFDLKPGHQGRVGDAAEYSVTLGQNVEHWSGRIERCFSE